jgi:predicted metal-dependent hydrolase
MKVALEIGDVSIDVVRKDIKNVHLSVHPPVGRVTITAPDHISLDAIRVFAIAKIGWIKRQQKSLRAQEREPARELLNRESHYVWGERYLMQVVEIDAPPAVQIKHKRLILQTRPDWSTPRRQEFLDSWYREQVKAEVSPLLDRWERIIGVKVARVFVQHMKTKWGSCNAVAGNIRLNTELAKKPRECLEYIVVHELVHLLEPTHNDRFTGLMDKWMPKWRAHQQLLNSLPVKHEEWRY